MSVPSPERPPTVLILGGLPTLARPLSLYLSQPDANGKARAGFVRLVDRFSVSPPSTYLDVPFVELLKRGGQTEVNGDKEIIGDDAAAMKENGNDAAAADALAIQYQQANLSLVDRHREIFTPPSTWNGQERDWAERGFEVVFDLTGEMGFDRPELMQIQNTHALALSLARSALSLATAHRPRAYVRLTYSFYEMKSPSSSSSAGHAEGSDAMRPDGVRGRWWHETLRGLARMRELSQGGEGAAQGDGAGLNVGAVQAAAWYGPGSWGGEVAPRVVVGHVYQYLKEDMKFLYNSDLRINTIHTTDLSQLLYLTSLYLLAHSTSSASVNPPYPTPISSIPAKDLVPIPFTFTSPSTSTSIFGRKDKSSSDKRSSLSDGWKTVPHVVPEVVKVSMPLFHAVDDGNSTQGEIGKAVGEVWGIKVGYLDSTVASLVQSFAKTAFTDMVDDVNEKHVEAWAKMLERSNPPIGSTPITPFLEEHAFRKLAISLDGTRARNLLGFKPVHPKIQVAELKRIVQGFQADGICGAGEVLWMRALKYAKLTAQAKAGLMPSLVRAAMPWRQRDPGLRSIMIGKAKGATSEDGRRA